MDKDSKSRYMLFKNKTVQGIVFSGAALLVFACILWRYQGFFAILRKAWDVLRPLAIGSIIAFALNPAYRKAEAVAMKLGERICKPKKRKVPERFCRGLALLAVYLLTGTVVAAIICFIIPQFSDSVSQFAENFDAYYSNFEQLVEKYRKMLDPALLEWLDQLELEKRLISLVEYLPSLLEATYHITAGLVSFLVDLVIGIVFSIYLLAGKRDLKRQGAAVVQTFLTDEQYERFADGLRLVIDTFAGFLTGQLTEAVLIGMFCFIGMCICGFEYAVVISVIVGVTNMIPIVGPFIGTIPSAFLLLLVNPSRVIWFVIYIVVLQQLESNLLYPRVVGSSVGLPAIWVLTSVVVGGGLFGVVGMILGVPLMSIIRTLLMRRVERHSQRTAGSVTNPKN